MLILPGTFVYGNNKGVSNTRPGSLSISLIQPIRLEHDATELRRNFIVLQLIADINYQLCMWYYVMLSTSYWNFELRAKTYAWLATIGILPTTYGYLGIAMPIICGYAFGFCRHVLAQITSCSTRWSVAHTSAHSEGKGYRSYITSGRCRPPYCFHGYTNPWRESSVFTDHGVC